MDLKLTEFQIDALKEVGNIGSGNAATALSQLINKKVDMEIPQLDILEFNDMIKRVGNDDDVVVAVLLKVFGDVLGNILFMIKNEEAEKFTNTLMFGMTELNEDMLYSIFQEVGNILGNSYLNAIAQMANMSVVTSVPSVAIDMLAAIMTTTFMDAEQYSENILAIDTKFIVDNNEIAGNFFFIPKPGSLEILLNKLGL